MTERTRAGTIVLLLLALHACAEPNIPDPDAGDVADAGTRSDAGSTDAGSPDGGVVPATSIDSGPPSYTRATTAELVFSSTVPGSTFVCALDDAPLGPCTSPVRLEGLADGTYMFVVRGSTPSGEDAGLPAAHQWTVDTVAPDTLLGLGPTTEGASEPAAFTFTTTERYVTFECALDGAPPAPCTPPVVFLELAAGQHTYTVRATDRAGNVDDSPLVHAWEVSAPTPRTVRIVAANTTSGNQQSYTPGHGLRIFQGLKPDIALIQEFNYGDKSAADLRTFVDEAFGGGHVYMRETGVQIPNGVISRFPILASGVWDDPEVDNREFAWARIDVPGPQDLWAVSVHLLTTSSSRNPEAEALVEYIRDNVPEGDYLVIGGDLNTGSRTEGCIRTLSDVVETGGPWPADHRGNTNTNASRSKPYDWLIPDVDLAALETPLQIGARSFPNGIVFDSRVFTPLSDVAPVLEDDSDGPSMQHMLVGKEFVFAP